MENRPVEEQRGPLVGCCAALTSAGNSGFHFTTFTIFLVHQQPTGSPEVNRVPDGQAVQILRHLPPFRVGRVGVLVVHLEANK